MNIPREAVELYLAEMDDRIDLPGPLQDFRAAFLNESDVELERKRGVMRARILLKHADPHKEEKLQILSDIIQSNVRRRADFERAKESSRWKQAIVTGVFTLLGALAGGWITRPS